MRFKIVVGLIMLSILLFTGYATANELPKAKEIKYLTDSPNYEGTPLWTSDGSKIIYINTTGAWNDRENWIMNADGGNKHRIYAGEGNLVALSDISPDGNTMLITKYSGFWYDLYKVDIDGSSLTPLANNPTIIECEGSWSPDGNKIAYRVRIGTNIDEIWIMNSDGSNKERIFQTNFGLWHIDWKPDGTKILFSMEKENNFDLWEINVDGSNLIQITDTPYDETQPEYSPDGKFIVYASDEDMVHNPSFLNYNLWLTDLDFNRKTQLTTEGELHDATPKWNSKGSKIVFAGHNWDNSHADIGVISLVFPAIIDIKPDTLNLKSNGKYITAYIEFPDSYDNNNIDISSVRLMTPSGDSIPIDTDTPVTVDNYVMVKFDRAAVASYLSGLEEAKLKIIGEFADGTSFEGTDTIKIKKG